MGHGLQHGIVELDGARDEQSIVRGLGRHFGGGRSGSRGRGAIDGFIFEVVRGERVSFGREGSVEFRQRQPLIQVSGNQTEPLRRRFGRQLFRFAAGRGVLMLVLVNSRGKKVQVRGSPPSGTRLARLGLCTEYRVYNCRLYTVVKD